MHRVYGLLAAACLALSTPAAALDLAPEQLLQDGVSAIDVPGYSVPFCTDWNGDGLYEAAFGLDLQRRPVRPNLGVFDGRGRLMAVLPRYGFGADVDGDGYDELISWTQWPDVAATVEIFGMDHPAAVHGNALAARLNPASYNEPD